MNFQNWGKAEKVRVIAKSYDKVGYPIDEEDLAKKSDIELTKILREIWEIISLSSSWKAEQHAGRDMRRERTKKLNELITKLKGLCPIDSDGDYYYCPKWHNGEINDTVKELEEVRSKV